MPTAFVFWAGKTSAWHGHAVTLDLAQSKHVASALAKTAKLDLDLPSLSMDAALSAGVGKDADKADTWHQHGLAVNMKWSGVPRRRHAFGRRGNRRL
jgi:hypothetical protein